MGGFSVAGISPVTGAVGRKVNSLVGVAIGTALAANLLSEVDWPGLFANVAQQSAAFGLGCVFAVRLLGWVVRK